MGQSHLDFPTNPSTSTRSLFLQIYQSLVGEFDGKEVCAFNEPSSLTVFPTDQQAATMLPGGAHTMRPTATLSTTTGRLSKLSSNASDRPREPLSQDTDAPCSQIHASTEAPGATAVLLSVHSASTEYNIVTTNTERRGEPATMCMSSTFVCLFVSQRSSSPWWTSPYKDGTYASHVLNSTACLEQSC